MPRIEIKKAEIARIEADSARSIAENEKIKTQVALEKAKKLIKALYFYDGRLALSSKEHFGHIRFGFINKDAFPVIDYKYSKAEQFDYTGLAFVTRDGMNYFIDTKGIRIQNSI